LTAWSELAIKATIEIPHHVPLRRPRHHRHLPAQGTRRGEPENMAQSTK
jgi:hypothetical protein